MGKIAVLGLGPSLELFNPDDFDYSIGVNDIWGKVKTNAVVCVDDKKRFTGIRLQTIENCRPEIFYSQIINWDTQPGFKLIKLARHYPDIFLDLSEINKSYISPFVACGIAFLYHQATEIHLFGVDLSTPLNRPLDRTHLNKVKLHFKNLKIRLEKEGCKLIIHGSGILVNNPV